MTIIFVAGPALSDSARHCGGIGLWGFMDDARLNGEHWRGAREGKPGYRLPDAPAAALPSTETPVSTAAATTVASDRRPDLEIPDLSIPQFLRRAR